MNHSRRDFLRKSLLGASALSLSPAVSETLAGTPGAGKPLVVSTWKHGLAANEEAWQRLADGASALDAAEAGVRVTEADPTVLSVGFGGLPDRDGLVTLDACVMNERGDAGSVAFLQDIKHPISVARLVMEKTPHVMLAGEGARRFALDNGFEAENLLTPKAGAAWREWRRSGDYKPEINVENHDTIGLLALDAAGNLSGCCTTSGLAYKMHGRVGDSPIIGAALFVDNEIGAACATGHGEAVMKTVGSFLVVELMRQGRTPTEACREAVERIIRTNPDHREMQIAYLALARDGRIGAYALRQGFNYARRNESGAELLDAAAHFD